ncbi:MAG: right-handed parallel beta-helix repeat-containing protein, partial [Syntrophus sp. (in: bacteria)]
IQLLRACDDLFRGMVLTIPAPTIAEAKRPPVITILVQDTKNLPKKAGDEIRVVIQGTAKMQASFDIGEFKKHIDMQEQPNEPGVYLGVYRVVPGDNVRKAVITGYLADDAGNTSQWVDAVGSVTLKTTPPDKPKSVRLVGRNAAVLLSWEKSADLDLAGYRVYRSLTPLSGYQEIARTEVTELRDEKLVNGQTYYYQVSAVDLAGNESDRAAGTGIPVTPGPTPVSGIIEKDTAWYAGASPYIIENTVIIKDKATLTIEAGTEIRSLGAALVIEGGLIAQGDGEHVISWDTATAGKSWEGILFRNVKEKEISLRFNRIQNAATGLNLQSSSPLVESCELSLNGTAVKISGGFAKPRLIKNTILKNTAAAVVITEGAQPILTENRIQDNLKQGILVEGAAPTISRNLIARNGASGIDVKNSQAIIMENNLIDNRPYNVAGSMTGESISALNNWWGSAKGLEILAGLKGRIDIRSVLNAPYPEGKPTELPILGSSLGGTIKTDGHLILSNSPYRIAKNLVIDSGATLYIEPGVILRYDQNTVIVVEDGGIIAKGTPENPIVFTASATSPSPGFYASAVRWSKKTTVNSALSYAIVQYADIALDIVYGAPDISSSLISRNAQSGIYCRNDAAPTVSFSTLTENRGEGAITVVGNARPKFSNNNIVSNDFAAQVRSTIYIDARNNWWGKAPPDLNMIMGDTEQGINIKPWLTGPEGRAYSGKR